MNELDIFKLDERKRPLAFNIAIINYTATKVFCLGYFRKPSEEDIKKLSQKPFAIFQPAEPHGWKVVFYSLDEVLDCIDRGGVPNYQNEQLA